MKHIKAFLAVLLVAAMFLTLFAGCAKTAEPAPETAAPAQETAPAAPAQKSEPAPAEPEEPAPAPETEPAALPTEEPAPEETEPVPETEPREHIEEYYLPVEDGCNRLTLYWSCPGADLSACDVWIWWDGGDGHGYPFYECDYGAKCMVNVPKGTTEVGFIVRRDCSDPCGSAWGEATKDFGDDRFAVMTGEDTVIYLVSEDGAQYESKDGGITLNQIRFFTLVSMTSDHTLKYFITPAARIESLDAIHVWEGERELEIESLSSLNNNVVTGEITTKEPLDITKLYDLEIDGYGRKTAVPTGIFDSADFIENCTYDGDDLGAVLRDGETTFKVWAPTASEVLLNLFEAGDGVDAYRTVPMEKQERGVWAFTEPCGHGTYYTYTVTTAVGTQEAVDPYAKAVGVNGNRGMVIDLESTNPRGFAEEPYADNIETYQDAVIWEVHVRDFSNKIADSRYPGKYLAFTETGLKNSSGLPVGVDYLKQLGITHVHLNPVYDYATVDESSDEPQFNWGYDPKNYNAPEGSYSTDPFHGEVRVNEFKQMVQALHAQGMAVVMDVVYNHTYDGNSNLNKIVPYYYYRYTATGDAANGSGCGNETASDRVMFRKYMVDSVCYWATEYRIDGFRFDLMGLHDVQTMQEIEQAVHAVNPKAILYGEGWTGGTTPLNPNKQATQANIGKVTASEGAAGGIAVFNDAIRDGLKGSVFNAKDAAYINGKATRGNANYVIFGITGGVKNSATSWGVQNAMVINYMSCHDNHTLWDRLENSCPDATLEEKLAMNRLGAAIVLLSKGTPFMLAGEEMLRTKQGDANSYRSSDEINNLDWEALTPHSDAAEMSRFYSELIALRRSNSFLTTAEVSCELLEGNAIGVTWTEEGTPVAYAIINPADTEMTFALPEGSWGVLENGEAVSSVPSGVADGEAAVPAKGVFLAVAEP